MITLTEADLQPNPYTRLNIFSTCMGTHRHEFFEILIVENGFCLQSINGSKPFRANEREAYLIRPSDYHSISFGSKDTMWRDFYVSADEMKRLCDGLCDGFYDDIMSLKPYPRCVLSLEEFNSLQRRVSLLNQTLLHGKPYPKELGLLYKSILVDILAKFGEQGMVLQNDAPDWLNELYLRLTYYDYVTLSADEITQKTGFSKSYIARLFKKYFGCTFIDYCTRMKVIYSANLLGRMRVIDIAQSLGWENPKNYGERFKAVYGLSPKQYAMKLKKHEVI